MKIKNYFLNLLVFCFLPIKAQPLNKKTIHFFSKDLIYQPLERDYLYIADAEISNLQYLEYLNWLLKNNQKEEYNKMLPDTQVWRTKLAFNEPYVDYYFRHPAYKDYPVVGVSYMQANAWCIWAANRIMEGEEFKKLNLEKIMLRLPTEKEWMKAARGTLPETAIWPWEGNTIRMENGKERDRGKIILNIKRGSIVFGGTDYPRNDAGYITTPTYSYWPNTIGLYNVCGNVAEWVQEHKAKGGSWNDLPYNARIDFNSPVLNDSFRSATIGFRPVLEIISYKKALQSQPLEVNAKMITKQLGYVKDSLFASFFETSNHLYNTFLAETKNTNYAININGWAEYTPYDYWQQYGWHPNYDNFPVVNISYESAVKFCEWLTEKYNHSADRKYKKVQFKLPTEREWELAARGGRISNPYPWGGSYYLNSKGCYLANFCPLEEANFSKLDVNSYIQNDTLHTNYYTTLQQYNYPNDDSTISRGADGAIYPCAIDCYFPNDYGLWNCAGNVSEMLITKGVCKGGSWTSSQQYIQIEAKENYIASNANLGFRYFMQVLEK